MCFFSPCSSLHNHQKVNPLQTFGESTMNHVCLRLRSSHKVWGSKEPYQKMASTRRGPCVDNLCFSKICFQKQRQFNAKRLGIWIRFVRVDYALHFLESTWKREMPGEGWGAKKRRKKNTHPKRTVSSSCFFSLPPTRIPGVSNAHGNQESNPMQRNPILWPKHEGACILVYAYMFQHPRPLLPVNGWGLGWLREASGWLMAGLGWLGRSCRVWGAFGKALPALWSGSDWFLGLACAIADTVPSAYFVFGKVAYSSLMTKPYSRPQNRASQAEHRTETRPTKGDSRPQTVTCDRPGLRRRSAVPLSLSLSLYTHLSTSVYQSGLSTY